jgi:transposase-like protein
MKKPITLQQAIVYFGDAERAFVYAKWLRWPEDKVTCPRCESDSNSFVKTRKIWFCNGCKKQFTVKVGTIFEDSPIGLDKWMTAVWMICNCKNRISSYELHRAIGVTQKSAWFMLHRIREAMKSGTFVKMGGSDSGPIEVDEAFVGGKIRNMHRSNVRSKYLGVSVAGSSTKPIVMGMRDRETR